MISVAYLVSVGELKVQYISFIENFIITPVHSFE